VKPIIVLDSAPLGLLFQKTKVREADDCRAWLGRHLQTGVRVVVPEIVNYELRRELLRLGKTKAVTALDAFNRATPGQYRPIVTGAMDLAAELWATTRAVGLPTADVHALDVDVILAAQVLHAGLDPAEFVVATSNVGHLGRFVPADLWQNLV
jgi:predicted nucleic acid-binding protein